MPKIKVITDSTSYISKEYLEREGVSLVPLNYVFAGETYKEAFVGEFDDFYNRLASSKDFPTTSQPSVGDFHEVYEESLKEYDQLLVITLSEKLSGTHNSASLAKDLVDSDQIYIVDSNTSASNLRFLVEDAVEMAKEGKSIEEIIDHIEEKKNRMQVYLTTGTLEYLSRGGRLSAVQASLGNLLNVKPIIQLADGKLELAEKIRGKNKALSKLVSFIHEDVEKIAICQTQNMEEALKMKEELTEKFPHALISIDDLGPVIGCHLGPDAIGICFY